MTFLNRLKSYKNHFIPSFKEIQFSLHNLKAWRRFQHFKTAPNQILLEVFPVASSMIAYSYFANTLAEVHNAHIQSYTLRPNNLRSKLFNYKFNLIYRSFNSKKSIYIDIEDAKNSQEAKDYLERILPTLKTKSDVEFLEIDGVPLGDLIYDSFTMHWKLPTVEIQSKEFKHSLLEGIAYFLFWRQYLEANPVKAIIVSHAVYSQFGIICRIAIQKKISVYQVTAAHLYCLNENRNTAYLEFLDFPKVFRSLSPSEQQDGLDQAKERLERRFSGEVGVDMPYSKKSSYSQPIDSKRVLSSSDKFKVLIAPHCFFDSPHPYGHNLFPDCFEWLNFLGKMSERTPYEWYVKTHPDFIPENVDILDKYFYSKYPKLKAIPSATSHHQLISEGIGCVFTIYGTIGAEYAALNRIAINASQFNKHISYDFNINPKTIAELEEVILKLDSLSHPIDQKEVYEYYFMEHLFSKNRGWLYKDYEHFMDRVGRRPKDQSSSRCYEYHLDSFAESNHAHVIEKAKWFINSKDYFYFGSGN